MTTTDLNPMNVLVSSNMTFDRRWRPPSNTRSAEIQDRESLKLAYAESASVAVLPGELTTAGAIARENTKIALIELVKNFYIHGLSWDVGSATRISSHTANSATEFIRLLPSNVVLPGISPDGEDGLLMAWEGNNNLVIAVLDGRCIHLVAAATTPHAQYLDDVLFDGKQIPANILELLPAQ